MRRGGAQKPQHATAHERWLARCCTQERVAVRHCGAEARKHSLRPDTAARWAAGARCGPKLRRVRRQGSALGTGRAGIISVMHCEFTATCSTAPADGKRDWIEGAAMFRRPRESDVRDAAWRLRSTVASRSTRSSVLAKERACGTAGSWSCSLAGQLARGAVVLQSRWLAELRACGAAFSRSSEFAEQLVRGAACLRSGWVAEQLSRGAVESRSS